MTVSTPQSFILKSDMVRFTITNYGARLINAGIPGVDGKEVDVLQGYDTLDEYVRFNNFYGTVCGRVANRIAGARFTLDGKTYTLNQNVPGATLHGGPGGFHTKMWTVLEHTSDTVILEYVSPDGEEGYPGKVTARVTYSLEGPQSLRLTLEAASDQACPVNLAHLPFFNLAGHDAGHLRHHFFKVNADYYYPMDEFFTIDNDKNHVNDTVFDLRNYRKIFPYLSDDHPQIQLAGGYDHNFELHEYQKGNLREVASIWEETGGRMMKIHTTLPGIQFYTCNSAGNHPGKENSHYPKWGSFCLEPQFFPNSPNVPTFPDSIVRPGEPMKEIVIYEFDQRESLHEITSKK
ncbi:galactose mutarotase [Membranicola marinus]|uniref:Aldose 1-epimerase n=1 Tax=Membranihabitans marinus TaxID=1227546 RepID=A0A953LCU5_9BACT|nr:aldose epimerase family protein [Membranihabitans marinus]MBY5958154.1 galactose mutarotase [Membranihabitans marinus]